jgi:hypothetical protein
MCGENTYVVKKFNLVEKKKKMENVVCSFTNKRIGGLLVFANMCFCMSFTNQRPLTLALGKLAPALIPWVKFQKLIGLFITIINCSILRLNKDFFILGE